MKDILKLHTIEPLGFKMVIFISDDLSRLSKNLNKNKEISKFVKKTVGEIITEAKDDGAVYHDISRRPRLLLIKTKTESPTDEVILHEVTHIVQRLEEYFEIRSELEFRAYLTESIYRYIKGLIKKPR